MAGSTDVSFFKRGVSSFWRGILGLVVAIGGISLMANFAYQFFTGEVVVTFVKPDGRGYVFNIENQSPVDQVIKSFRVAPDTSQKFFYKVTNFCRANERGDLNAVELSGKSLFLNSCLISCS